MKNIKILFVAFLLPAFLMAQSVSPEVVSSAGDYYEGSNGSLSWTLGEIATETYSNGTNILTQGFQQPITVTLAGINLDVLVYLEGPYSETEMSTNMNMADEIPLAQPYNTSPWNYTGTESVGAIPNTDVVDWVIVELRDAVDAVSATGATKIAEQAAFLLRDGSVVDLDGSSTLEFSVSATNNLFVAVWHRNHLGVMSAVPISGTGGSYSYDFSTSLSQAYGGDLGYKLIATGVYGMPGGDFDADGDVDNDDKVAWAASAGTMGYQPSDFTLDNQVSNEDKNDVWVENTSLQSQVPE